MKLTLKSLESLLTSSLSNVDARMNKIDKRIDRMQSDLRCDLNLSEDRLDMLSLKLDAHRKRNSRKI